VGHLGMNMCKDVGIPNLPHTSPQLHCVVCTSRKHYKIKPQSICPLRCWDPPWFAVNIGAPSFLFSSVDKILSFFLHAIHRWKGIFKPFPTVY
jgi:hypothetical protein